MIQMPNVSFQGEAPPIDVDRELLNNLKSHVIFLANDSRGRNHHLNNSLAPSKSYACLINVTLTPIILTPIIPAALFQE
jgi:hypothetical protein